MAWFCLTGDSFETINIFCLANKITIKTYGINNSSQ